jgi:hypothetical protein
MGANDDPEAPYEKLLRRLGFDADPFADMDADREGELERYYVKPPFFAAVYGEPDHPKSSVVFAPRGFGKTALKRMIEAESPHKNVLCVSHNRFPNSKATYAYHLERLIVLLLVGLVTHIADIGASRVSKNYRDALLLLADCHLRDLSSQELSGLVNDIATVGARARSVWNQVLAPLNVVLAPVFAFFGQQPVDVRALSLATPSLGSLDDQFALLLQIARNAGLTSVYVLVDRIDETESTGNDPEKTFEFIAPLLTNLGLIEQNGVGFKFFLWDRLEERNRAKGRTDRIPVYRLQWSDDQILRMLVERLRAFSSFRLTSFDSISKSISNFSLNDAIVLFSMGSPRNTIRLCKAIIDQQSNIDPGVRFVTEAAITAGFREYSRQLAAESTEESDLQELKKIHRLDFTLPYVYNDVLKIKQGPAQRKIQKYLKLGLIEQVGRKRYSPKSQNLSNHYAHTNVAVAKAIYDDLPIADFMRSKVRTCEECKTRNVRDWDLDAIQSCRKCSRESDPADSNELDRQRLNWPSLFGDASG